MRTGSIPVALPEPATAQQSGEDRPAICAVGLAKSYRFTVALAGLDLHVAAEETVAPLGQNLAMQLLMYRPSSSAVWAASMLQLSDGPCAGQVCKAVAAAMGAYRGYGCAERVAQEFGDHPETAVARMHWALGVVGEVFAAPGSEQDVTEDGRDCVRPSMQGRISPAPRPDSGAPGQPMLAGRAHQHVLVTTPYRPARARAAPIPARPRTGPTPTARSGLIGGPR